MYGWSVLRIGSISLRGRPTSCEAATLARKLSSGLSGDFGLLARRIPDNVAEKISRMNKRLFTEAAWQATPNDKTQQPAGLGELRISKSARAPPVCCSVLFGGRSSGQHAQNRTSGNAPRAPKSVDTLMSRQRSASAARVASASPAFFAASLPSRRCAGRRSAAANRRMT